MLERSSPDLVAATAALQDALGTALSPAAVAAVKEVCHLVTRRAARLSAAGIVAVLTHMGQHTASAGGVPTVAVDGGTSLVCTAPRIKELTRVLGGAGLYEHHAVFAAQVRDTVAEMGVAAQLRLTPDGSGVGAALLAAAASR